jgi:tetratricopeptide (TPR) repeat protein
VPRDISCRLVFLASPGGLADERAACRDTIADYHATRSLTEGATFYVHAWEDVSGGVGRPQDLINPDLDSCDYLLVLLGDTWGSPPGGGGSYTSGTEEEFHRALELLADETKPLRDILVLFKTLDPDRLRDPGEQLKSVMDFRARLEESKSLMFETFDSIASLTRALERKLTIWGKPLTAKNPVTITLPTLSSTIAPDSGMTRDQLLESARALATDGLRMQAEAAYATAIADGDPAATLEYAQFMRRTGRVAKALQLNNSVLENRDLLTSEKSDAVRQRVNALANIGVIHRKEGRLVDSVDALKEAVATAHRSPDPINEVLCYALDNYGHTLLRAGYPDRALEAFEEAHQTRQEFGSPAERAQSAINLGHMHIAGGAHQRAADLFEEALGMLTEANDGHLRANARCGLAEARLRDGSTEGVNELLTEAISLNEGLQNSDGLSIAHALIARYQLATGDLDAADQHIAATEQESQRSGNSTGLGVAAWLRSEVARLSGDHRAAQAHLEVARRHAEIAHSPTLAADLAQADEILSSGT